jgi:hypothetical protein
VVVIAGWSRGSPDGTAPVTMPIIASSPDHGVELVFPVRPVLEAFFDAAEGAGALGDAERFRPSEQAGDPCQPIRSPSLPPPRAWAPGGRMCW